MVTEYGMSDKVGQVYFATPKKALFLPLGMEGSREYSEATARLIDNEVGEIINEQHANALESLRGKKTSLKKAAGLLLVNEKMDGEELKSLMDKSPD